MICTQLHGIEYSNQILIIFKQTYLTLTSTKTPGLGGLGSNGNKLVTQHRGNLLVFTLTYLNLKITLSKAQKQSSKRITAIFYTFYNISN